MGRAVDALTQQAYVDPDRVIIWDGSRGSELALMAAGRYPTIKGAIVEAPSGLRWASVNDASEPAWTFEGVALPFMPSDPSAVPEVVDGPNGQSAYATTPMFLADMAYATDQQMEAATIDVERVGGPVLLLGGADDLMWPSCELAEVALGRLEQTGHTTDYDDRYRCFEDAGHVLGPPGWPTGEGGLAYLGGNLYALGGTLAGTAHAQRKIYVEVRSFLGAVLD